MGARGIEIGDGSVSGTGAGMICGTGMLIGTNALVVHFVGYSVLQSNALVLRSVQMPRLEEPVHKVRFEPPLQKSIATPSILRVESETVVINAINGIVPVRAVLLRSRVLIGAVEGENKLSIVPVIAELFARTKLNAYLDAFAFTVNDVSKLEEASMVKRTATVLAYVGVGRVRSPVIPQLARKNCIPGCEPEG